MLFKKQVKNVSEKIEAVGNQTQSSLQNTSEDFK